MPPGHHFAAGHPPPASGGPSLAPAEGLLMAGEGGVLFSLRAARRQMLACSLPVIKRPPARLSPALCCAAKRRHAASCCGPWRAPHRRRRRCRARSGRSPRASAAVAGVWGGCDGACCRTPRAGGGRLTVPHRGRAPLDALPAWHWGVPLPCERWRCCSPAFGVRRGRASPAAGRWLRLSPAVPRSWIGEVRAACATQGLCKLLGTALAHRAVPCRAAGSDTRALPAGPCCPFALTALVPAPSQCCWGNFCHWEIPLLPLGSLTGLPTPAAVVPWLCNLLPPARMAHEPSWLTGVCRVLLLLTPARGVLYP